LHQGRHRRKVEPGHNRLRVRRAGHTDPAFSHGAGSGFDVPPRTRRSLVAAKGPDVRQGKVYAGDARPPARAGPTGRRPQADSDGTTGPPAPEGSPRVLWGSISASMAELGKLDCRLDKQRNPQSDPGSDQDQVEVAPRVRACFRENSNPGASRHEEHLPPVDPHR
jgi:hypothetical protein